MASGEGADRAGFEGLCAQPQGLGIHPGASGECRSLRPGRFVFA